MWIPSIIIVTAAGAIDLSSLLTPKQYFFKLECEKAVAQMVKASKEVYPGVRIQFAACVAGKQVKVG